MIVDLSGIWEGTIRTKAAKGTAVTNIPGMRLEVAEAITDERPVIYDITLSITAQSVYAHYGHGYPGVFQARVSVVSGHLNDLTPLAGFVDETGLVKLSFMSSGDDASTFSGRLTATRVLGEISGICTYTGVDSVTVIQQFSTLHVKKGLVSSLYERAYLEALGRNF